MGQVSKLHKYVPSFGRLFGRSVIYGRAGEHDTPYMTRYWIGRLRLHIFYRGDQDEDCHDHPWDFWTFPFTSYVEEVVSPELAERLQNTEQVGTGWSDACVRYKQVVPAWRLHHRKASHCHRVLGPFDGWEYDDTRHATPNLLATEPLVGKGKIVTLVWRGGAGRKWGFLKLRDGRWCWTHWKEYVYGGGKDAPCSEG